MGKMLDKALKRAPHESDEFMSRVMSNLDGNQTAKIASLTAVLRAVAAARMPGQARRIALEALRDHVGPSLTSAQSSQPADSAGNRTGGSK